MTQPLIYLDANATTPVHSDIANEVMHCMQVEFGNPSSSHITGLKARRLMEDTRQLGQQIIGGEKGRLLFTSGATEGIQTSIVSALVAAKAHTIDKPVLLYGATEHKAVPNTLKHWNNLLGINADILAIPVNNKGQLDTQFIAQHVKNALIICTMIVNNETGVAQDITALDKVIRDNNPNVYWMVDCVQGLGKQQLELDKTTINYAPFSGHKLYAPKGIGFLYLSDDAPLTPFIAGGGQESGARSGTENLPGIAGLKKLFELMLEADNGLFKSVTTLNQYREKLKAALEHTFDGLVFNNDFSLSVPTTLNFSVADIAGAEVMNLFDAAGIRVSAGSACSSGASSSFVLDAMGLPSWQSENAIRLSFGPMVTADQIDQACDRIMTLKQRLYDACMLDDSNKHVPCAVGINQFVVGDNLMYLLVNDALEAVLYNPVASEMEKITRLLDKQGICLKATIEKQQLSAVSNAQLTYFDLAIHDGRLVYSKAGNTILLPTNLTQASVVSELNSEQLKQHIAAHKTSAIIDIREHYEHQEGELNDYLSVSIDQVKNIPAHRLLNEFAAGNLAPEQEYVLVCRSGRRSKVSCQLLNSLGFNNVMNLSGGVALI